MSRKKPSFPRESYSAVLLPQGEHRFFQISMPSDILAQCSFVSRRSEDPLEGFQRTLDAKRVEQIAEYIDSGLGTIPTSIILSAQKEANLDYDSKNKTISFDRNPHSFLILDGQHRVYAFRLANQTMRVPVVVYNNLSRQDEVRLFVDINSKQRGVPNELLLDIKALAAYESDEETRFRNIFDLFNDDPSSPLFKKLSSSSRSPKKISRVTFNSALKTISSVIENRSPNDVQNILGNYLIVFSRGLKRLCGNDDCLTQSIPFKAIISFFVSVASKLKDKYGADYSVDNFSDVLQPVFDTVKINTFYGASITKIKSSLDKSLKVDFSL